MLVIPSPFGRSRIRCNCGNTLRLLHNQNHTKKDEKIYRFYTFIKAMKKIKHLKKAL